MLDSMNRSFRQVRDDDDDEEEEQQQQQEQELPCPGRRWSDYMVGWDKKRRAAKVSTHGGPCSSCSCSLTMFLPVLHCTLLRSAHLCCVPCCVCRPGAVESSPTWCSSRLPCETSANGSRCRGACIRVCPRTLM
jgi:hypothetical protein